MSKKRKPVKIKVIKDKLSRKAGTPPGTLTHIGREKYEDVQMEAIFYNSNFIEEIKIVSINDCFEHLNEEGVLWINVFGVHNTRIIKEIGEHFNLHPLVLEDIVNTEHLPKFEDFEDYLFITLKKPAFLSQSLDLDTEQLSFILGRNFVISFLEDKIDLFESFKERLVSGQTKTRARKADYLLYGLIDYTIDTYYHIIEVTEEKIENLEEYVVEAPNTIAQKQIQQQKRNLVLLRKSLFPLREALNKLLKRESSLINETSIPFINDLYDHTIHIIESIESQRDILSGVMDIYLTNISNNMNKVMKVLTIISTIFIPITFLAGVYGMNFKNFPEINWTFGYLFFWTITISIILLMLSLFKWKKWF